MQYDPDTFWGLTPREFDHRMKGARIRLDAQASDMRWSLWVEAALQRAKKLPALDAFTGKPKPRLTTEERIAAFDGHFPSAKKDTAP